MVSLTLLESPRPGRKHLPARSVTVQRHAGPVRPGPSLATARDDGFRLRCGVARLELRAEALVLMS